MSQAQVTTSRISVVFQLEGTETVPKKRGVGDQTIQPTRAVVDYHGSDCFVTIAGKVVRRRGGGYGKYDAYVRWQLAPRRDPSAPPLAEQLEHRAHAALVSWLSFPIKVTTP